MGIYKLVIKINNYNMTFIDLYKGTSNISIYSQVCSTSSATNKALDYINKMNIQYEIHFYKI